MSLRVRLGSKRKPKGWEIIEETLYQFEDRLREAVDDVRASCHEPPPGGAVNILLGHRSFVALSSA